MMKSTVETMRNNYETHRPILHFSVEKGWMNDPNGLIYKDGYYNLYYQYHPDDAKHGPMHWGHARSKNLLEWEHLPVALYPDENGVVFSGSIVDDQNHTSGHAKGEITPLVAIYTSHKEQNGMAKEAQSIAFSYDGGIAFEKYKGNPVLDEGLRDFRDPKVIWHQESERWIMLLVAGREVRFYQSLNLIDWNYLSTFQTENRLPGGIWECPDLHQLKADDGSSKWVLIVSVNTPDGSYFGMQYFVGDFDGKEFRAETPDKEICMLDFGYDNYAAVTYNGVEDRAILTGWMNCWYYGEQIPASEFRGSMTIPRELNLKKIKNSYRLIQKPVREIENVFQAYKAETDRMKYRLPETPALIELKISEEKETITLTNGENSFQVNVNRLKHSVEVDRRGCGHQEIGERYLLPRSGHYFSSSASLKLTLLVDVTSVEIFVADGEAVGTFQYFIDKPFSKICVSHSNTEIAIRHFVKKP